MIFQGRCIFHLRYPNEGKAMSVSAIEKWLIDEFLKPFQQKASEYLATLIWFDPNRYWLSSIPWLVDRSTQWTFSLEEGNKVPMKLVAVGSDIPEGKCFGTLLTGLTYSFILLKWGRKSRTLLPKQLMNRGPYLKS